MNKYYEKKLYSLNSQQKIKKNPELKCWDKNLPRLFKEKCWNKIWLKEYWTKDRRHTQLLCMKLDTIVSVQELLSHRWIFKEIKWGNHEREWNGTEIIIIMQMPRNTRWAWTCVASLFQNQPTSVELDSA